MVKTTVNMGLNIRGCSTMTPHLSANLVHNIRLKARV